MHAYVINLAHATERWELMEKQLNALHIDHTRVEGVYGNRLSEPIADYNERKYRILHGKTTNKGEVGCYLSHIKTLRAFLCSDANHALVLEDDVQLPDNILNLIEHDLNFSKHWNLLRLTAFTPGEHLSFADLSDGFKLSYNLKVLKNTGAYVIDRKAAQCVLEKMLPMFLPYDVALDREWHYGFKTACISPLPIPLNMELPGQIPPARKIRFYRSTSFHAFHALTHLERKWYRRQFYKDALCKTKEGLS